MPLHQKAQKGPTALVEIKSGVRPFKQSVWFAGTELMGGAWLEQATSCL